MTDVPVPVNRVKRLSEVQGTVLVSWGQSEGPIRETIRELPSRGYADRARTLEVMLDCWHAGLTREEAVAHIILTLFADDPEPEPIVFPVLPRPEYVAEFPVSWIKPRNLGFSGDVSIHDDRAYKGLEASIKRYGFTEAIVLNPDYSVADGQMRYEVATMMGIAAVPVTILTEFSDGYVLYVNQLHRWSRWDFSITDMKILTIQVHEPDLGAELRELGWFVNDVPTHLTAPSLTLEAVAEQIVMSERAKIYEFKAIDLLFIEPTRWELIHFWEAARTDEYSALALRARDNHWDLGGYKNVATQEVLEAAVMDVLNFIAFNLKRAKAEKE